MKKINTVLALASLIAFSSLTFASDRYNQGRNGYYNDYRNHQYNNDYRKYNRKDRRRNNRYNNRNNNRQYQSRDYRHKPYYGYQKYRYNKHKRHYKKHYKKHYGYYNNYRPYGNDYYEYRYRPARGLGHYFERSGYGYGHWHDAMWCDVYHPESFYVSYYSDYPYRSGWRFGDGDFGIWFSL